MEVEEEDEDEEDDPRIRRRRSRSRRRRRRRRMRRRRRTHPSAHPPMRSLPNSCMPPRRTFLDSFCPTHMPPAYFRATLANAC